MVEEESNASENSFRVSEGLVKGTDLVIPEDDDRKSVKSVYGLGNANNMSKLGQVKMHLSGLQDS